MQINLGGIGKEYAVDPATAIALKLTNQPCLINFGGNIRASQTSVDQRGWQVGIESLENDQTTQRVIRLQRGGPAIRTCGSHTMLARRTCLLGGAAVTAVPRLYLSDDDNGAVINRRSPPPHKDAFQPFSGAYLNCASQHPPWRRI
jgi:hypothetical protein